MASTAKMNWAQMDAFAREYLKHDVFVYRLPNVTGDKKQGNRPPPAPGTPYEKSRRRRAQRALCRALGLRNNHTLLLRRIAGFQQSLYTEVSKCVRLRLCLGEPPAEALHAAPESARRAIHALQLLPIALKNETKILAKEGAATAVMNAICAAWEGLRGGCAGCADGTGGGAGGCAECRSAGEPPRAALRAAAQLFEIEDTGALLRLWVQYREVALGKLRALAAASDDAARLPPAARPAPADWRVVDLALLHDDGLRLLTEESVTHHEQLQPLIALFSLVQQHGLEGGSESAWLHAHRQATARGSCVSLVLLQRRWRELCGAARARVLAAHARAPAPTHLPPLHQALVRRYPHVATRPLPTWRELVAAGRVYVDFAKSPELQPPAWLSGSLAEAPLPDTQTGNEDDLILVEKDIETIELGESDGEIEGAKEIAKSVVALARETRGLQNTIRDEIQNQRDDLKNTAQGLLKTDPVIQNDNEPSMDTDVQIIEGIALLKKDNSKNAFEENKDFVKKSVVCNKANNRNGVLENESLVNECDVCMEAENTIVDTSTLNSLDTGQPLAILQKIDPESSEAMIIFEDDDDETDNASDPSGNENGVKGSVDLCNNANIEAPNVNKDIVTESPELEDPDNPASVMNINSEVVPETPDAEDFSNQNCKSTEKGAVQNLYIIDKNIEEYKAKIKSEMDNNLEIALSHANNSHQSAVDVLRENLGKDLCIASDYIPKINNLVTIASKEVKPENKISNYSNTNEAEMVVESNVDVESNKNNEVDASEMDSEETDSASNVDAVDFRPECIDPKLLMTPSIPLTRVDSPPPDTSATLKTLLVEDFSAHPDFNMRLKDLRANYLMKNWNLLMLCRPLSVSVERMSAGLLDRYLGHGRRARRVRLPDIEEVRRENRRLLTAQVAPTPLPAPRQEPSEVTVERRPSISQEVVENEEESMPTEEELMELLQRCEPTPARARTRGFSSYCCLARRHRAHNDARRRLAARAARPPPPDLDIHGTRHWEDDCNCCCMHLIRGAADGALAACAARQLRRLERAASALLQSRPCGANTEESDDDDDDKAHTNESAKKKKTHVRRTKKTNAETEIEENIAVEPNDDDYQEWIRQKNLTTKYFHIKAVGSDSIQRIKHDNTNTDGQRKYTNVSTKVNKEESVNIQNKYVARVFGKLSKEGRHLPNSVSINANSMHCTSETEKASEDTYGAKVVAYKSTNGQQIVKMCRSSDETPKKYANRKRKSLGNIVENTPNMIKIRIPSQNDNMLRNKSKNKNLNVVPTISKSNDKIVEESTVNQNEIISGQPYLVFEPNFENSAVNVARSIDQSANVTHLQSLNQSTNTFFNERVSVCNFTSLVSHEDSISHVETIKSFKDTAIADNTKDTKELAELNTSDSDDDFSDKLFIDENIQKLSCSESQNSDGNWSVPESVVNEEVELLRDVNSDISIKRKTQNESSVNNDIKSSTDVMAEKVSKPETEDSRTPSEIVSPKHPDDKVNETSLPKMSKLPKPAEKIDKNNKDDFELIKNCKQNNKSDETFELKPLQAKKVYQKVARPKLIGQNTSSDGQNTSSDGQNTSSDDQNTSSDDQSVTINVSDKMNDSEKIADSNTQITEYEEETNESAQTLQTLGPQPSTSETCLANDSDDDVQIIEPESPANIELSNPRSLLRGQPANVKVSAAARPLTLLEQIAQMHQKGKKFVIKKVNNEEHAPILYHSATNYNQVSRYVELVPEFKKTGQSQAKLVSSQPVAGPVVKLNQQLTPIAGPVVNLNQQLASMCSPVTAKKPIAPQVLTIKQISPSTSTIESQEPNPILTLDASQTNQLENAQVLPVNDNLSLNASGLVLKVSRKGMVMTATDDMATLSAVVTGGEFVALPRISSVTSLAEPPADGASKAKMIVMKSVSTQSGHEPSTVSCSKLHRLSPLTPLPAWRFVQHRDPTDITVLCLDSSKPLMRLVEDYLVVTEMEIPCKIPTYWTLASDYKTRMIVFDQREVKDKPTMEATQELDISTEPEKRCGLKVKSFAKLVDGNALEPPPPPAAPDAPGAPAAPDRVHSDGKVYKKLSDNPLIYAKVLHVVSTLAACRRVLAAGAELGLRARAGRVLRVLRTSSAAQTATRAAPSAVRAAPTSTGLRCDAALPALTDLVRRLNEQSAPPAQCAVINLDSDDE